MARVYRLRERVLTPSEGWKTVKASPREWAAYDGELFVLRLMMERRGWPRRLLPSAMMARLAKYFFAGYVMPSVGVSVMGYKGLHTNIAERNAPAVWRVEERIERIVTMGTPAAMLTEDEALAMIDEVFSTDDALESARRYVMQERFVPFLLREPEQGLAVVDAPCETMPEQAPAEAPAVVDEEALGAMVARLVDARLAVVLASQHAPAPAVIDDLAVERTVLAALVRILPPAVDAVLDRRITSIMRDVELAVVRREQRVAEARRVLEEEERSLAEARRRKEVASLVLEVLEVASETA